MLQKLQINGKFHMGGGEKVERIRARAYSARAHRLVHKNSEFANTFISQQQYREHRYNCNTIWPIKLIVVADAGRRDRSPLQHTKIV